MRHAASLTAAERDIKGRNLNPENHSKQAWWRTRRNCSGRGNVPLCMNRAEFGNLYRGHLSRNSASGTHRCGYALRSLQEAATMLILARQTAGSELERSRIPGLAEPRTARMACRHGVVVSGHVLSRFTRWMHAPNMHDEHRRHGHLYPSHHDHKQRCRDGFLQHPASLSQIKNRHGVTTITSRFVSSERQGYSTRFSSAARNSR